LKQRPPGSPIRVLIVEDSRSQLELLTHIIRSSPDLQVAGAATNGQEAVDTAIQLRPDVISMDIHLPVLDGYEATRQIMQRCPTPIVMVSNSRGDAGRRSMDALAAGALAVIQKPGSVASPAFTVERDALVTTLRLMADVPVITRHARPSQGDWRVSTESRPVGSPSVTSRRVTPQPELLAIAASTGGPVAVQTLLTRLGSDFPLPILVAQHIARGFVSALAEWLDSTVPMPVHLARHDEKLQPGHVYLAPEERHLVSTLRGYAWLRHPSTADRYCPSADTLFESLAGAYGTGAIGVILTGMGDDGARGLKLLRQAGAHTIAQDEASCVVYGMPRAAVEAGAAERIEPLLNIAAATWEFVRSK
jgi:two-component system chemotaxis response regulator CheB